MRYGNVYIFACVAIVSIGIFAMYYFTPTQSYNAVTSQSRQGTPDCIGYFPKARELAENSIPQYIMTRNNLHPDGIQCVYGTAPNGTRELLGIKLDYPSNDTSGGTLIVTEDPTLTQVINATLVPKLQLGPAG
jgi:hypothetical protein